MIDAGLVGDETDAKALKFLEVVLFKDIDASQDFGSGAAWDGGEQAGQQKNRGFYRRGHEVLILAKAR